MRGRVLAVVGVVALAGAGLAIGVGARARRGNGASQMAARASSRRVLTDADYARAEKMLAPSLNGLELHGAVTPEWKPDDTFTYVTETESGLKAYTVDAAKGTREETAAPAGGAGRGRGGFGGRRFGRAPESTSPDGKTIVFIRDWNLWARDAATKKETQLTTDGVENFGYATDNAGWSHSDRPIVLWSPDSRKIATFQQDQRGDGENYLVSTPDMSTPPGTHHPVLEAWKFPLPGDKVITTIQRVVIALDPTPRVIRFQMPPDQHRSTDYDDVRFGPDQDVQWSPDGSKVCFISTSRDHKTENVRVADAATGAVRDVYEEKVATYYEGGQGGTNFRYLPETNEFIWFSERTGWGQLYMYDLTTGKLKNRITHVQGQVTSIRHLDTKNHVIYFYATGSEAGENPYYLHLYRVNFDGSNERLLTPEDANHNVSFSPSGKYFEDSYSTPVKPPVSVLRDSEGKLILTLEKADISRLKAAGWVPPIQVKVKGRDHTTDIYGLMFQPSHLDRNAKYPIVNHIYPGPQTGSVGTRNFSVARGDDQALAELGFVVVELDGMGTPWRGKKFHDTYYGHMEDNTLPDQVIGMQELAKEYPYIDINRAGIFGHSGGGDATAGAMFHYADFFKVGISESGNHDQGLNEDDWGEKWQGLVEPLGNGKTTYSTQGNENYAANLKGHLLLAHGTMDSNVPPEETMLIVDALIKANKDFDLLLLPNQNHGYGPDSSYMMRRRWDYFVRYLMGATPPKEYKIGGNAPARGRQRP
ncbi:MAG TPA: DPP IV N-terminal domain-containing protein [Candidatus Acidoferrales bacterium]|nr:DPP IV N-terminal domain-containing protein [Candidatus Acidoferrales bacterium]